MRINLCRWKLWFLLGSAVMAPALWSYVTGPDPFKTGRNVFPGESDCTEVGCHSTPGKVNAGSGSVKISVNPYKPGEKQTITVTVSDPAATQKRWGYQLTARVASSPLTGAGSFSCTPDVVSGACLTPDKFSQVICGDPKNPSGLAVPCTAGTIQFAEHTEPGTRNNTPNGVSFQIDWTAPSSNVGDIIFAAAGNAANGNNTNDAGDNIYTTTVTIKAAADTGPAPQISSGGVVGAGLSNPLVTTISPGGIISIFGVNFAPAGTAKVVSAGDLVDGKLPTNFAGLCVQVGGARARFFHVFSGQLNVQVPTIPDRGNVAVQVIQNCDQPNAAPGNTVTVAMQTEAPEFFFFRKPDGTATQAIAATDAISFALIGSTSVLGAPFTPAKPGEILTLFATGFGPVTPSVDAGVLPSGIASTVNPVTVTIGGINAPVLYAGVAPGLAGLYQINIQVPDSAPDGDLPVVARIESASTPQGAFITVKK